MVLCLSLKIFSQSDLCSGAVVLSTGVTTGTNLNFTTSGTDPAASCVSASGVFRSGWYKYTTDAFGGNLSIKMTYSASASISYGGISIYSATSACSGFAQVGCNDPNSSTTAPSLTVTCLSPNTTYYIMVFCDGNATNHSGAFSLNTTYTPNSSADLCSSAIALSAGTVTGDNTCATFSATTDQTVSCQGNSAQYGYTVWYKYTTGASGGDLSVSLASGTINYAALAMYSGTCGSFTELDCDDPNLSVSSPTVSASCLSPNTTYYIMVWCDGSTSSGYSGTFTLTTSFATNATSNNTCSAAITLSAGTLSGNNSCATADATTDPALTTTQCSGYGNGVHNTVWYTYTTPATGANLTVSLTRGTIKFAALSILAGTCGSFTSVACNDPDFSKATPSVTANCLSPNTTYYIMVWCDATNDNHGGTYTLTTTSTAPGNDCCFNATALSVGTTTGTNVNATTDSSDPSPSCDSDGHIEATTWYTYTTPASCGNLTISLTHSTIQYASLTLYSGSCGSFTEITGACSDPNSTTANPSITVGGLSPSTTYYLEVWSDGLSSAYDGTYSLTTTYSSASSTNDYCGCATAITMNPTAIIGNYLGTVTDNNTTATADGSSYCYTVNKNLWYTFVAPVTASYYCGIVAGTIVDPEISVSTGSCGALTEASCAGEKAGVTYDAYHSSTVAQGSYTLAYAPFSIYSSGYTYGAICSVTAGTIVHVMVDNYSAGSAGTYTLTIANLKNDDIAQPLLINSCGSVFNGTTIGATNCGAGVGDGYYNNLDNNAATACDGSTGVTSCGSAGGPGSHAWNYTGCAAVQCDANMNGGDIGFTPENDSWYEFCVTSTCTVTITFNVNSASCLVPTGGTTALQLAAFTGASNNLTKIYGGYFLESITTTASFSFAAAANTCYFFEVDGYTGTNCNYTLQADIVPTCVLPVKLLFFTGTNEQGKIKLNWASAEETNSGKYIIERSDNGIDYVPIITKKAIGNTTEQTNYTAYDENPLINKINYYKLSEYDLNGKGGLLSQTFVSNTAGFPKFSVYPNPSNGTINIKLHNFGVPSVFIEIIDVLGTSVWSSNVELTDGNSLQQIDLSALRDGVYIVRTSDGTTFYKQQLMISK
ncbi:MAG: T9SS type A sorting domain-containing protein [Bacteroidia bacterium]